jgi:hypothetical protein
LQAGETSMISEKCLLAYTNYVRIQMWRFGFWRELRLPAAFMLFGIVFAGGEGFLRLRSRSAKHKLPHD